MIRNKYRSISTNYQKINHNQQLEPIIENQTRRIDKLLMQELNQQPSPTLNSNNNLSFQIKQTNPFISRTERKIEKIPLPSRELPGFNKNKFMQIQQLFLGTKEQKCLEQQPIEVGKKFKLTQISKSMQQQNNEIINLLNQEKMDLICKMDEINKRIQKIQKISKDIKGKIFQYSQREELNIRTQEEVVDSKEQKCKQIDQIIKTQKNFIHEKLKEYLAEKEQIEEQTNFELEKLKQEEILIKKELDKQRSKEKEQSQIIQGLQQEIRQANEQFLVKVLQIIQLESMNSIDDQYHSLLEQGIPIKIEYLPKEMNETIKSLYFQKIMLSFKIKKMTQIKNNPIDFLQENPNITSANFDYKIDNEKNKRKIAFLETKLQEIEEEIFTNIITTYEKNYPKYKNQIQVEVQKYLSPSRFDRIDQKIRDVRDSWYRF